jgi:scyllo-inositol 2-dehydrogenase (NADP+)
VAGRDPTRAADGRLGRHDAPVNDTSLRVALAGFGLAGAVFHAPLIAATPGLDLDTVVTRDPQRADQARRRGANVVASIDEALATEPDLLVVATPNRHHVDSALAAIAAGVAVVVDKPLAPAAADARRVVEAAEAAIVPLTVFHNRRLDGDFLTVRRLLDAGDLGEILRFESRFERWRPEPKAGWREKADPAEGGGVLLDLGPHLVDQALQLLGPAVSIHAEIKTRRAQAETDDDAFIALEHESGAISHLWMSAIAAAPGPRFRVLGSHAAYVKAGLDGQEAALRDGADPAAPDWGREPPEAWGRLHAGDEQRPVETVPGAYPRFYALVRDALLGEGSLPVDPADAVTGLELLTR